MEAKFEVILNERVLEERDKFQTEVAGWIARLRGIESAVEGSDFFAIVHLEHQKSWTCIVFVRGKRN